MHVWVSSFFLGGALVLEAFSHPHTHLSHLPRLGLWLWKRPVLLVAWIYALWTLLAVPFAVNPIFALTGSPEGLGDGALWVVLMVAIATLIALRVEEEPSLRHTLLKAIYASGLILTLLAAVEVINKRAWIGNFSADVLPQVTFASKGHLAGFLGLALGGVIYLANPFMVFVLAMGVGLTYNRASLVGVLIAFSLVYKRYGVRQVFRVGLIFGLGLVLGLWIVRVSGSGGEKPLESSSSLEQRWYGWKAAVAGIADRPWMGYGAGGFHFVWPRYLSEEDLAYFLRIMWGAQMVLSKGVNGEGIPAFGIVDMEGRRRVLVVDSFKAHNEFLDQALLYGLPGAALWLCVLLLAIRWSWPTPVAAALIAYLGFLGFWYNIFYNQGVFWAFIGIAGGGITARSVAGGIKGGV